MKKSLLIISFLLSLSVSAQIFVNASATGANDGSSWTDAYTDLQTALANDTNGDNIWIAAGTYTPGTTTSSLFNLNVTGVSLYGGFNGTESILAQRDPAVNQTILSGDLNGNDTGVDFTGANRSENAARVLVVNSPSCLIDGLTISGGHAVGTNGSPEEGAALFINNSNFTVRNCTIVDNVVSRAGVIRAFGQAGDLSIENTIISNNLGEFATVLYSRVPGGTINLKMVNCLITNNIKRNVTTNTPALMWFRQDVNGTINATLTNCTVADNTSETAANTLLISGTRTGGSNMRLVVNNSIFKDNISISGGSSTMMNSIGNGTSQSSATLYAVRNSIDESAFSNIVNNGSTRINNNNLSSDPLFSSSGDYTLSSSSPAIDAGDNALIPTGITSDLDGNSRIAGNAVDMGAYESAGQAAPVYVDINATGTNDGTSWANAYSDLLTALNSTQGSRDFWIAAGSYIPGTARTNSFQLNRVGTKLYGGFDGTETMLSQRDITANETILSGDINGNDGQFTLFNSADRNENILNILNVTADDCLIDGITISGGQANDAGGNATQEGAAIRLITGNFTIDNCKIEKNAVTRGGVIQAIDVNGILSISNTIMSQNLGRFAPLLYARAANAEFTINIENCLFVENQKQGIGPQDNIGFFWFRQDNSNTIRLSPNFRNCTIANNTANLSNGNTTVISATRNASGGALNNLRVFNTAFHNNINITSGTTDLISVGNGTTQDAASIYEIRNSIDHNAFSNIGNNGSSRINSNNLTGSPMFTSSTDYTLQSGSPAIDAGDNQYVIAVRDLAENNRVVNGTVDMGAYEFQSTAGLEDLDKLTVSLYPNPAGNLLNVISDLAFAKAEIYNLQGQQVAISKEPTIQVADLRAGMYLIKVVTKDGATATQRFIKK